MDNNTEPSKSVSIFIVIFLKNSIKPERRQIDPNVIVKQIINLKRLSIAKKDFPPTEYP